MTPAERGRPRSRPTGEAWDAPPPCPSALDSAPVLSVEGFKGPLDWLLALVRAQRIDLAKLSILALAEAFGDALDQALRQAEITPAVLARWCDWLVMATDLVLLRSRPLLTAAAAEARTAQDQAEALRRPAGEPHRDACRSGLARAAAAART